MHTPFGYKIKGGRFFHVDEVDNGKKCACFCPGCDKPLIAVNRQDIKVTHHFRHYPNVECTFSPMTMVHKFAQQILVEEKRVLLPEMRVLPQVQLIDSTFINGKEIIFPEKMIVTDRAEPEYSLETIRADVMFEIDCEPLLIEIHVENPVDDEKKLKVLNHEWSMIEISLKNVPIDLLYDYPEFKDRVLSEPSNRKWINHPPAAIAKRIAETNLMHQAEERNKLLRKLQLQNESREAKEQEEKSRLMEKRRQEEQRAQKARDDKRRQYSTQLEELEKSGSLKYRDMRRRLLNEKRLPSSRIENAQEKYLHNKVVGLDVWSYWIFEEHPATWQNEIIEYLLRLKGKSVTLDRLTQLIVEHSEIVPFMVDLLAISDADRDKKGQVTFLSREENKLIIDPVEVVNAYLNQLQDLGLVSLDFDSVEISFSLFRDYIKFMESQGKTKVTRIRD